MIEIELTCYLKGDNFDDTKIKESTGLKYHNVSHYEKKDLPIKTYTKVVKILPLENDVRGEDDYELIKNFSAFMEEKVPIIKKYGCDNITLLAVVKFVDQCNMAFDQSTIKAISSSFDHFHMSCYEVDEF